MIGIKEISSQMFKKWTLRSVLIFFSFMIVGIMLLLLISVIETNKAFYRQLDKDLNKVVTLQLKIQEIEEAYDSLRNYTLSEDINYLDRYFKKTTLLSSYFDDKKEENKGQDMYFLYYDINNMFESFLEQAEYGLVLLEEKNAQVYINQQIILVQKNIGYLKNQLELIISEELLLIKTKYGDIEIVADKREEMTYIYVVLIILLILIAITVFTQRLANPIHQISEQLMNMEKGQYNRELIELGSVGEIRNMVDAFNKMKLKLVDYIEVMNENAYIREKLKNQEIELLASENTVKQSRLDFLQAQINPHFLYNTLNSIQTLADIEEAPQTEKMLEHLSCLIRYNLKKSNEVVSLKEELETVNNYIYIQLIRFGNRIVYDIDVDEKVLNCRVPSMILQPLVENAMNHGIEPKMGQRTLRISAQKVENEIHLVIYDDGIGIKKEKIVDLFDKAQLNRHGDGMTSKASIGLMNVIRRCQLFYGENIVYIESEEGIYTRIILKIPLKNKSL
jgi:two-component system, sensor histidine kinase YesM